MKENFKQQLWISISVIVGSMLIVSVALYLLSSDLAAQAHAIVLDRATIQRQADARGILASLEQDAPRAAQYTAAIKNLLPDQYGLVGFGRLLQSLGDKHSVGAHFSFSGDVSLSQPGVPGREHFVADAEGSPQNILAFMNDLESKAPAFLTSVDSFDFTNDNNNNARIAFQGILFFR